MRRLLLCCVVSACGRVAFDPLADGALTETGDGPDAGDTSLIAHYTFDDDANTGLRDVTGHGHDGVCATTCPVAAPAGRIDGAHQFNGASDYFRIADAPDLHAPTLTVTAWLWFDNAVGGSGCPFQKRFGSTTQNSWQIVSDPNGKITICTTESTGIGACDGSLDNVVQTSGWHHVALVETGARHLAYVNAVAVVDLPAQIGYDAGALLIGADIDNATPTCFFDGRIDDVRIYGRALDPAELADLAAQ